MATTPGTITFQADVDLTQIVRALLICEVPVVDIDETPIWWHLYHQKPYFRMLCDVEPFDWRDWSTPALAREHFGLVE